MNSFCKFFVALSSRKYILVKSFSISVLLSSLTLVFDIISFNNLNIFSSFFFFSSSSSFVIGAVGAVFGNFLLFIGFTGFTGFTGSTGFTGFSISLLSVINCISLVCINKIISNIFFFSSFVNTTGSGFVVVSLLFNRTCLVFIGLVFTSLKQSLISFFVISINRRFLNKYFLSLLNSPVAPLDILNAELLPFKYCLYSSLIS